MNTSIHDTPQDLGRDIARRIIGGLGAAIHSNRAYILGCPGGRSAMPVYVAMTERLAESPVDCSRLVIAMMDEYLLSRADGGLKPPPASAHFSCRGFGEREILGRINSVLPADYRIPAVNLWLPDAGRPEAYDDRLRRAGGIDLFLLASGAGDGHIAFNPPGSPRGCASRIVELNEQTRRDNLATFPQFRSLDEVPSHGVTVGIGTIASLSASAAMIVWGEGKKTAFKRISEARAYDSGWPATIVSECRSASLHADRAAADR